MPSDYPIIHDGQLFSPNTRTPTITITPPVCVDCHQTIGKPSSISTGYGRDREGNAVCFACCGIRDAATLAAAKPGTRNGPLGVPLYLSCDYDKLWPDGKPRTVSNWPGSLSFPVFSWNWGKHNWGLVRHDVWFRGPSGAWWWGVQYGENTQLVHCRKLKSRPRWMS